MHLAGLWRAAMSGQPKPDQIARLIRLIIPS
jgi:hypothetical protein